MEKLEKNYQDLLKAIEICDDDLALQKFDEELDKKIRESK